MDIIRWGLSDGNRLARTVGKELKNRSKYSTEEFIGAAEIALKKHPDEWVIHYSLGDKYQEVGRYAEALKVTQNCVDLRPNDVRSTYALATSYNILTRAAWTDEEDAASRVFKLLLPDVDKFDKRYSQAGLDHTGLAIDTAAAQAIRWYEKCLVLKHDAKSDAQIRWDLATLYERFPHLRR